MPTFDERKDTYAHAWHDLVIDADKAGAFDVAAHKVIAGRPHYDIITSRTGVPWAVIGLAHLRESDCNFKTHLHNGDSLVAKTHHVPAGRPPGDPPFSFDDSAVDALRIDGLSSFTWDSIERVAYALETFNGFGYYKHGLPSAYLWAGTNQYRGGKYVADNKFDRNAVDRQLGTMGVLKRIAELQPDAIPAAQAPPEIAATSYKAEALNGLPDPSEEPGEGLAHPEMHVKLKGESWSYGAMNWLRNKLGLPAAGGAAGVSLMDDPMSALGSVITFVKSYGLHIVAAAIIIILVVEGAQAVRRQKAIEASK